LTTVFREQELGTISDAMLDAIRVSFLIYLIHISSKCISSCSLTG